MHIKKGLTESNGYELLGIIKHFKVSYSFLASYQACLRAGGHFQCLFEHAVILYSTDKQYKLYEWVPLSPGHSVTLLYCIVCRRTVQNTARYRCHSSGLLHYNAGIEGKM